MVFVYACVVSAYGGYELKAAWCQGARFLVLNHANIDWGEKPCFRPIQPMGGVRAGAIAWNCTNVA